jgi:hypothetical protein
MAGGGVPTAAEVAAQRSSSARGFPTRKTAKLWSNSCSRRRGSCWGGRIGWRRGGGRGLTATGAYRQGGDRRRRAPVKDWRRGGVVELWCGMVKLSRWSSGTMGGSRW